MYLKRQLGSRNMPCRRCSCKSNRSNDVGKTVAAFAPFQVRNLQTMPFLQALHSKVEAALEREQAAHRAARARITKAEERAAMECTARRCALGQTTGHVSRMCWTVSYVQALDTFSCQACVACLPCHMESASLHAASSNHSLGCALMEIPLAPVRCLRTAVTFCQGPGEAAGRSRAEGCGS